MKYNPCTFFSKANVSVVLVATSYRINLSTITLTAMTTGVPVQRYSTQSRKYTDTILGISCRCFFHDAFLLTLIFHNLCAFSGQVGVNFALIESHEHAVMHRDQRSRSGYSLNNMLNFSLFFTKPYHTVYPRTLEIYGTRHMGPFCDTFACFF